MWWERRRIACSEPVQPPVRSAKGIAAIVLNCARVAKPTIRSEEWMGLLREGYVKLNIDATFSVEAGSGTSCAVIHDDQGRFISTSSCAIEYAGDAPTSEACALRDGLIMARNSTKLSTVIA